MAKELLLDDQSRFNKVMEMFPENFIDDFINYFLWNGHYEKKVNTLLDKYNLYSREVLSEFIDKDTNRAWQQFNESFYALRHFLATEFDIPQAHFEMYDKPPFVYLKPAWHHNFNEALLDREKREPLWHGLKKQLDEMASEFEKKYRNFVRVASVSLSKNQSASTKNKVTDVDDIIVAIIEEAENDSRNIKNGDAHRSLRDKWLNTKRIFDAIYDKFNVLDRQTKATIDLDIQNFLDKGIPNKEWAYDTLENLIKLKVIRATKPTLDDHIVYSTRGGLFLNGKIAIIVDDVKEFKNLHLRFTELNDFIQKDGEKRFPKLYPKKIKKVSSNNTQKQTRKEEKSLLKIKLKGCILLINEKTGEIKLNKNKKNINPKSKEFKVLYTLATNNNYLATYEDLLGEKPSKVNKRNLSFTVRNLRNFLGILPKKKAINKDIIKNIKNYGYSLIT
jgi:hypothetical protein